MADNNNNILIFRTNIWSEDDKQLIKKVLDNHVHVRQCSVDLHDIDRVLRVVSHSLNHNDVIQLIKRHGFECAELE